MEYIAVVHYDENLEMCHCVNVTEGFGVVRDLGTIKLADLGRYALSYSLIPLNFSIDPNSGVVVQDFGTFSRLAFGDGAVIVAEIRNSRGGMKVGYRVLSCANLSLVNLRVSDIVEKDRQLGHPFVQNGIVRSNTVNCYGNHSYPTLSMNIGRKAKEKSKQYVYDARRIYIGQEQNPSGIISPNNLESIITGLIALINKESSLIGDADVDTAKKKFVRHMSNTFRWVLNIPVKEQKMECLVRIGDGINDSVKKVLFDDDFGKVCPEYDEFFSKCDPSEIEYYRKKAISEGKVYEEPVKMPDVVHGQVAGNMSDKQKSELKKCEKAGVSTKLIENSMLSPEQMRVLWVSKKNGALSEYFAKPEYPVDVMKFYADRLMTESVAAECLSMLSNPDLSVDELTALYLCVCDGVDYSDLIGKSVEDINVAREIRSRGYWGDINSLDAGDYYIKAAEFAMRTKGF